VLGLGLALAACSGDHERAQPRLVVLVSLDTLRADHLEIYGYARETAPNLARLAADGLTFTTCSAQAAQTLVSHKSLFAGKYPLTLVHEQAGLGLAQLARLESHLPTLVGSFAAVRAALVPQLQAAGWRTAAFTDGGWMSGEFGFDQGFDAFRASQGGGLAEILGHVAPWIDALRADERAFLFLHTYDIHCPYSSRAPHDTRFCADHAAHQAIGDKCGKGGLLSMRLEPVDWQAIVDHYDGGIASTDAWLGLFLERLKERGLYDEALIIVTADHGESLGEAGQIGHGGLRPEQLHVPLVVKPPRSWGGRDRRVGEACELVDVLPTILAACGIEVPAGLDGRSLWPSVRGAEPGREHLVAQTTFEEQPAFITNLAKRALIARGRWMLIDDALSERVELYDLASDPHALADVRAQHDSVVATLQDALHGRERAQGDVGFAASAPVELPDVLLRELQRLGYLGGTDGR
jgi:arylsulfatase A-like enzyme